MSDVSRAPHSLPFANITCCMRVSFESGREITSLWAGSAVKSNRQQPTPAIVTVVVSLMQWPCGALMPGGVPEPGCCCFGGRAYVPTGTIELLRLRAGTEFNELVLVIDQTTIWFET